MVSSILKDINLKIFVQAFGERVYIINYDYAWYQCGNCEMIPTPTKYVRCQEISATADKIGTSEPMPSSVSLTMRDSMLYVFTY